MRTPELEMATEDDSALEEADDNQNAEVKSIKWTIRELCDREKSLKELQRELSSDRRYEQLDLRLEIDEDFWKNTFLGFSFIVPDIANESSLKKRC